MKTAIINDLTGNETLKTIFERRAVRKYRPDMIDDDVLNKILDAGCMAPSAMNGQPWKFYIATHKDTIASFSEAIVKIMPKMAIKETLKHPVATIKTLLHELPHTMHSGGEDPIFHGAPVVVFITAPKDNEWAGLDIGMCAQNLMLAAKSLGLDSCPIGFAKFIEQTPVFHRLEVPDGETVQLAVILGYGVEKPEPHPRAEHNVIFIDRMECC
ncbi:nitroreductase family protein [Mucilaginibacter sp. UR6-11]|uniref:nitroreductase family protein n=1 Tax=Mucilaginibacter sp. UR6-11 TaxID=1435644 RepID=UPI001E36B847|nr:nitroreductase family protein [Mucilaginibacter sp. UR6-11]MCC8426618.1 nitroreductase [Mucilaginibacter sp. UR6-11]